MKHLKYNTILGETLDKKANVVIRLPLLKDITFNILRETAMKGIIDALV